MSNYFLEAVAPLGDIFQRHKHKNMTTKGKVITGISVTLVVALAAFVYFKFYFVYGSGVNAGELNYFQKQGVIFKTYEGKIIQSGFKSGATMNANLRSNEFKFSVDDEAVAEKLMRCSGKNVELKWERYFGTLPWRGESHYIVTEVLDDK